MKTRKAVSKWDTAGDGLFGRVINVRVELEEGFEIAPVFRVYVREQSWFVQTAGTGQLVARGEGNSLVDCKARALIAVGYLGMAIQSEAGNQR